MKLLVSSRLAELPVRPDSLTRTARPYASRLQLAGLLLASILLLIIGFTPTAWATPTFDPCGPTEVIGGVISMDTVWYQACSPFTVTGSVLVDAGVKLMIEPGVVVQFASGTGLQVNGTLIARGTSASPIIFTSSQANPAPGDWKSIFFADSSTDAILDGDGNYTAGSILEYCEVRYAGSDYGAAVSVDRSSPLIDHCAISDGKGRGLRFVLSSSLVRNTAVTNNASTGIEAHSSTNVFAGLTVSNNNGGLYIGGGGTIQDSLIEHNRSSGIFASHSHSQIAITGNTIRDNAGIGLSLAAINSNGNISNNEIAYNITTSNGGGIYLSDGASYTIRNNRIHHNQAADGGGISFGRRNEWDWESFSGDATLSGNVISDNRGTSTSGGVFMASAGNNVIFQDNTITNNTAPNYGIGQIYLGSFTHNALTGNTSTATSASSLFLAGTGVFQFNDVYANTATYIVYLGSSYSQPALNAKYNWWGTTDASALATQIYDFDEDANKGLVAYSPLLAASAATLPQGPANPSVSVTGYAGSTINPILILALSATAPTEMLVSDDPTFPTRFHWEPFVTTKNFHSIGTKYIYAKYRDAAGNESAIAFARPRSIMYIIKGKTLPTLPALIQARVAGDAGAGRAAIASVAAVPQVTTYYRPIGGSSYTALPMALAGDIRAAWIPASALASGVEYYIEVKDENGNVTATVPESNPATNPLTMAATSTLQQALEAAASNVFELAVGLSFDIPAGALSTDTDLQVSAPSDPPQVPPGITLTGIGYRFALADGTTTFGQPIEVTFNYSDDQVVDLDVADLRVYYTDGGMLKLVGGTPDTTARTLVAAVNHFSDFFVAEGKPIYPAPITEAMVGEAVTIRASVVDYLPVRGATLHYRIGSGAWQNVATMQSEQYFEATIPGGDVTLGGIAYYIEASDGSRNGTYPAADPVNHPQVIIVKARPALAAVTDLRASRSSNAVALAWSAVIRDVNNNAVAADHYIVYRRANAPYFTPGPSDILDASVSGTAYPDESGLSGPEGNYSYVVVAVDSYGQPSGASNRVGVFRFALQPGRASAGAQAGP